VAYIAFLEAFKDGVRIVARVVYDTGSHRHSYSIIFQYVTPADLTLARKNNQDTGRPGGVNPNTIQEHKSITPMYYSRLEHIYYLSSIFIVCAETVLFWGLQLRLQSVLQGVTGVALDYGKPYCRWMRMWEAVGGL
jgi:hypothetical protein